jgi:hypothetical protein
MCSDGGSSSDDCGTSEKSDIALFGGLRFLDYGFVSDLLGLRC